MSLVIKNKREVVVSYRVTTFPCYRLCCSSAPTIPLHAPFIHKPFLFLYFFCHQYLAGVFDESCRQSERAKNDDESLTSFLPAKKDCLALKILLL